MNKTGISLLNILGKGNSRLSIITSVLLMVISFFYVFTLGSALRLQVFPFEDRITYVQNFDSYVINSQSDHIIIISLLLLWFFFSFRNKKNKFLLSGIGLIILISAFSINNEAILSLISVASMPAILFFIVYNKYSSGNILHSFSNLTFNYFGILGIILGIVGLLIISGPIFSEQWDELDQRNYLYEIFLIVSTVSPFLIILLVIGYPVKQFLDFFINFLNIKMAVSNKDHKIKLKFKIMFVLFFILLSILFSIIPHLQSINPDDQPVGVDTYHYKAWIEQLNQAKDPVELLQYSFTKIQLEEGDSKGDRSLTLLLIFSIVKLLETDLEMTIEFLPLLFSPALILAVYFLTRELTSDDYTSLLAAFLTTVSFQTIGGIYAGYYANWLALIIGYMSLVYLIKFLKKSNRLHLITFMSLTVLTLLSHVYTWTIIIFVIGVFLIIMLRKKFYQRKGVILLLIMLIPSIAIDIGIDTIIGGTGGLRSDVTKVVLESRVDFNNFVDRWKNLWLNTTMILGGILGNVIMLLLCLYWLGKCDLKNPSNIFLMVFFMIGLVPIILGDWVIQNRILYDVPFQIPASIGLALLTTRKYGAIILPAVSIWFVAVSIRFLTNFHLNLPT